ncbi:armadillo-type protein [Pholiota molesta]|nr:armadillo-type protein [Pholiota molesta]
MDPIRMEVDEDADWARQAKRFRHQSYNQSLKAVHVPSAFKQSHLDHEVGDNDSHFHEALDHWRQLNLAPSFIKFAGKADGLSASMPLLLHNWRDIYTLWEEALKSADDEGLRALLDLLQKMAHDLRTTLSPIYTSLLDHLLALLPRTISAAALTALLETLASLFRYLLIPAINNTLLEETWTRLCHILPKCLAEIQRAVAEVWGGVLRRMKTGPREKAVQLLAQNAASIEDASAWVIVYASKSVSQTLHTCTPSLFEPLLSYHLSLAADSKSIYTLLRRSLTALIHHVKNADQFTLVSEIVVHKLLTALKTTDASSADDVERLRRILDVASVVAGVRQGSRLTEAQKAGLFAELGALPIVPELHSPLLRYALSVFMAGEMSLWLGPGLKFLQHLWNDSAQTQPQPQTQTRLAFTLKFHLCLAEAGWGGWKLIAAPVLFRATVKPEVGLVQGDGQRRLVGFLAALMRADKLGSVAELELGWKRKVEAVVNERLEGGKWKEGDMGSAVAELDDILTLLPLCSSPMAPPLVDIAKTYIDASVTDSEDTDAKDSVRIVALCMQAIAKRNTSEWAGKVDLGVWTKKGLAKWAWSHEFLAGLVALAQTSPNAKPIPIPQIYPSLYTAFLSHSRPLRLAALHLLDSKLVDPAHDQIEVLKRCLQGEEVALDTQGVRERVLRIGRVGQVVGDEKGADLCARWLVAQLKVNLRPLWSPAAAALAALSLRFGELVWALVFAELQTVGARAEADVGVGVVDRDQGGGVGEDEGGADGDPWEEERTWRDPSAHKVREVVIMWDDPEGHRQRMLKEQIAEERFDQASYEHQLLATLGECSALAEKHNRELNHASISSSALPKPKLLAWLTLFSKFSNPKALYATDTLRSLYTTLLSHPDRGLQNIALTCLFTYKSPHLTPFEDHLRALLDDTSLDTIPSGSRSEILDVFIRLLYGVMLEKKGRGRGGGGGGADRRAAVLGAFTGCTDKELGLLIDLMLRPFGWDRASPASGVKDGFNARSVDDDISDKQITGFLTLLGDVLKNLGSRLLLYWPAMLGMTINLISTAQARIDGSVEEKDMEVANVEDAVVEDVEVDVAEEADGAGSSKSSSKIARSIRQIGLKRFADFFRIPVIFDFTPYMEAAFMSFINPRLPLLDKENTQAPSALLELFYIWTVDGVHIPLLVDFNNNTLPKIYDCLIATNVKPSVVSRVFDIVDNILSCSAEDDYTRDHALKPHVSHLLTNLSVLVEKTKGSAAIATPIGQRQITILSEIAQYSSNSEQATTLLHLFNPLLRRPAKIVPERVKVGLVKIIGELIHLIPEMKDRQSPTYLKTYGLLSQLFQSLRSRPGRLNLVSTFRRLAQLDASLLELADLLESMNAYSVKRMDEPDFDRRISAFASLNDNLYKSFSCTEWLPVLYNMLNFIQDPAELAVRNSASHAMRLFIDIVAAQTSPEFEDTFVRILYPGLKNGLRSKNELVRAEVLGVIAYAVKTCEHMSALQEMRTLLEGGDEEANFFNNILHIQVHRRSRALRRLADHCAEGHLKSTTMPTFSTLVALLDNFHFPMEEVVVAEPDIDEAEAEAAAAESALLVAKESKKIARIADAKHEKHDANTDENTRIPIAVGIVTVAMHLPTTTRDAQITRLVTILSQILRSKSQETRDLVRDSLNRIAVHLGPSYLPLILRELRAALLRGPQLHVLAYAIHSLIPGSSSRGLDSFAVMAKFITPARISSLLSPVKKIMQETESIKVMALVDEVLKRIATGLNGNQHLVPTELIVLCNTLISQNAKFLQQIPSRRKNNIKGDAIVQMKRKVDNDTDHYANNSFRFVAFGLELLHTALKRNRFDFREPSHIARLESIVVVVGNTLYSTNAAVLALGMRCAAGLAKCPLKAIEKSLPVIVRQILDIIKQTGNTESEIVQVAFKSLATILRDGPPVQVKEKDLVYLIELLSPDLEDHTRQASVFTLLRAIVSRKFVVPEIYDLMEKVSEVSVTSQSPQVQELCRGVLLQFLLDYPQGKGRLRNQMAFFAKNLSYVHESGRTSIMELLGAVVVKFQVNLIQEYADLLFVALVMAVANDESSKCREMAAQLIKNLWTRLDEEHRNTLLSHLHSWASQNDRPLLAWVSAQVCGFVVDITQTNSLPYIQSILDDLNASLERSAAAIHAEEEEDETTAQMDVELEWQLPYHSLTVLAKVLRVFPDFAMQGDKVAWPLVVDHLLFPHAWVRTAACRLLGLLFTAVPVAAPQPDLLPEHPLSRIGMQLVARKLTQQLKSEHLDQALSLQIVKNLFYLGKCFYLIPMLDATAVEADAEDILDNEGGDADPSAREAQQGPNSVKELNNPLPWLFSKLSYQIKSGHIARRSKASNKPNWSQQPLASLRWFAAMASHMEAARLETFLVHILTPVYRITEDDIIRDSQMEELKTTATELQDLVQSKVGTTKFASVYNQIRQSVLGLRRERKVARRNIVKKDSRKRKERSFLDGKGKVKRRREE